MQSKAVVKSSPLLVIKLPVPLELLTGNELLQLQRHVHGEGDDVVIENHPEQEHLQDPDKGDLLELVQIPDPGIGDIGSQEPRTLARFSLRWNLLIIVSHHRQSKGIPTNL